MALFRVPGAALRFRFPYPVGAYWVLNFDFLQAWLFVLSCVICLGHRLEFVSDLFDSTIRQGLFSCSLASRRIGIVGLALFCIHISIPRSGDRRDVSRQKCTQRNNRGDSDLDGHVQRRPRTIRR